MAINNLAALLLETNRPDEAEPLMRRALAIDEQAYGSDHPEVATDLNNLAQLLRDTNRLEEAEQLAARSLNIKQASLPEGHPSLLTGQQNLAAIRAEIAARKKSWFARLFGK